IGSGVTTRPSGPRSTRLAPPNTAGATLSGWPSSSVQSSASAVGSSVSSSSAAATAAPATVAAAEDPSPRATGMSESAASARPAGTSRPARRQAAAKPRYSRSASGAVSRVRSVPARSIAKGATGFPAAWYPARAVTRSQRPTATPTQSNPAPRLDVEPATRTVTLARIALRVRETEKPAQCHAAGGRFLARSLTWRQYAANHHDHFGCMYVQYSPEASGASRSSDGDDSGRHSRGDGHRRAALPAAARAPSPVHRHRAGGLRPVTGPALRRGVRLATAGRRAGRGARPRRPGARAAARLRPRVLEPSVRRRGAGRDAVRPRGLPGRD